MIKSSTMAQKFINTQCDEITIRYTQKFTYDVSKTHTCKLYIKYKIMHKIY